MAAVQVQIEHTRKVDQSNQLLLNRLLKLLLSIKLVFPLVVLNLQFFTASTPLSSIVKTSNT